MTLQQAVLLTLQVSVLLTVFGFGLQATTHDLLYLDRPPALLARSVLAMFVVMPIVAVVLVRLFELRPAFEIALVALAISPVPPLLPKKEDKAGGESGYGLGLMAAVSLLAIVLVPLLIEVVGRYFARPMQMPAAAVAKVVVMMTLLPLVAGVIVRERSSDCGPPGEAGEARGHRAAGVRGRGAARRGCPGHHRTDRRTDTGRHRGVRYYRSGHGAFPRRSGGRTLDRAGVVHGQPASGDSARRGQDQLSERAVSRCHDSAVSPRADRDHRTVRIATAPGAAATHVVTFVEESGRHVDAKVIRRVRQKRTADCNHVRASTSQMIAP